MKGRGIDETIRAFATSCTEHSRALRYASAICGTPCAMLAHLPKHSSISPLDADTTCSTLLQLFTALYRTEALQFQHRAARHMHLQSEAATLEAEAATWKLLCHLYANTKQTYPAGVGGHTTAVETVSAPQLARPLTQLADSVNSSDGSSIAICWGTVHYAPDMCCSRKDRSSPMLS